MGEIPVVHKKKEIHKVKNKGDEIFEVECTEDEWKIWPDNRPVVCKDGENIRKFLKGYLKWAE